MIFIKEEDKLNPSPTVESNPKPKSDPFVTSIGSPESIGKERCLVSGGTRGGWHCVTLGIVQPTHLRQLKL